MNLKDLIERLRRKNEDGTLTEITEADQQAAADAIERLTQPVGVEPCGKVVERYEDDGVYSRERIIEGRVWIGLPLGSDLYSAETVARLIAERDESLGRVAELWQALSDMSKAHDALQEQVKMLQDVLHANKDLSDPNCPLCKALAATEPKDAL